MACQPDYGGYDCEFVDEVPEHLSCIVCLGAFREPHLLSCCGKKVCHTCITLIQNAQQACPHCREKKFHTMLDKDFNRQVLNLKVYCSKKGGGCGWTGDLRQLEEHLKTVCQFVEVSCRWECGQMMTREKLREHEEDECPLRPHEVKLIRAIDKMEDRLVKLEVLCGEQKKEINDLTEKLNENEQKHEEEKKELKERLEEQEKQMKQLVKEIDDRRQKDIEQHAVLIDKQQNQLDEIKKQIEQDVKTRMLHIEAETGQFQDLHRDLEQQLHEKVTALDAKTIHISDSVKNQLLEGSKKAENNFATKDSVRVLQDIFERISRHGMKVPDWQLPVPVTALTDVAPCQYTMYNFSLHKGGQKTWYSPPFFNEPGGYKFCLRVDSHGMLEGKSTHLSVWVYVMRGLHDEALKWPFTGKVTIQLLNWKADRGHVHNIIAFDDQAGDKVRQRVTAGECAATGRGSSRFVSHDILIQHSSGKNAAVELVRDDCLCFKISKVEIV